MEHQQTLEIAIQHHTAGRLDEAEDLYRRLLAIDPNQPEALHLSGVIALQNGQTEAAVPLFNQAISVKPNFPEAHNNLGTALKVLAEFEAAAESYKKALIYKPDFADAYYNLGALSGDLGRFNEAASSYRKALVINPKFISAQCNLAAVLIELEKFDEAIEHYQCVLAIEPEYVEAHLNLGHLYKRMERISDAATCYKKVSVLHPESTNIHLYLGQMLQALGDLDEAKIRFNNALSVNSDCAVTYFHLGQLHYLAQRMDASIENYQKSLTLDPKSAETFSNLGLVFHELGNTGEALKCYQNALTISPGFALAHFNLGNEFQHQRRLVEAVDCYHKALEIEPDFVQALNNLGTSQQGQGRLDEAISNYRQAISIEPDYAEAHNNLGNAYFDLGDPDQAVVCYKAAVENDPEFAGAYSNWLLAEHYRVGHTAETLFRLHDGWDQQFGVPYKSSWPNFENSVNPDRKLRIGFMSADLGRHPVGYFVVGLFENLKNLDVETICYSDRIADDLTVRIKESVDIWRDIGRCSNEDVISTVLQDGVDILFDLAGHSGKNRLAVFARKPAPIQIAWAGYVGTTGLSSIDYLLSDRFSTYAEEEKFYSEKIIYMPDQWLCYDPPSYAPDVGPLPLRRNGFLTFGSFCNPGKLNADVITVWAGILAAVEGSQLIIKYRKIDSELNIKRLSEKFEAAGICRSRLILEGRSPHADLLERYNDIDIALDPFPYSGGITTYEALWMGVPVITIAGNTFASRHSASHLQTVGYPEFVTTDLTEYAKLAIDLAKDPTKLTKVREQLRGKMAGSAVCDAHKFANVFVSRMRDVWRNWCSKSDTVRAVEEP